MGKRTVLDKIWDNIAVRQVHECWPWVGNTKKGYGYIYIFKDGKKVFTGTHKVLYEEYCGKIPDGFEIDHTCNNRECHNLLHMEEVTHTENMKRVWRRGAVTKSSSGHAHGRSRFTPAQISYIKSTPKPSRAVAKEFGCNKTQILRIRSGETYSITGQKIHVHSARS